MQNNMQQQDASDMDINIDNPTSAPTDSISCISWAPNPQMRYLACSSWDGKVRIYECVLSNNAQRFLTLKNSIDLGEPVLSISWKTDCQVIFCACSEGAVKAISVANSQIIPIGQHQAAVRNVFWIEEMQVVCSTSFDKTIKFWQLGNSSPAFSLTSDHKIFDADLSFPMLALTFSSEKIAIIDLTMIQNISNGYITNLENNPLGSQICSVAIDSSKLVIAIGGCDGRGNLSKLEKHMQVPYLYKLSNIMTFKAHKMGENQSQVLYPINTIGLNPRGNSYVYTGGGDGKMYFWDFEAKQKITESAYQQNPVTASKTSPDGFLLAYAIGYDWQKGIWGLDQSYKTKICVKVINDSDLKYHK